MTGVDICMISPGLLEAGTKRGGGIEEIDYQVALRLSRYFNVVILSPFYKKYCKHIRINERLSIEPIYFPAEKNYPPRSRSEMYITPFLIHFYSCLTAMKVMALRRKKLKLVIVHNGLPGFLSSLLAKIMKIKVIYSEGNVYPWVSPYITPTKRTLPQKFMYFLNLNTGKRLCKLSDYIRTQSNSIKGGMINYGIDSAKIRVINGGVDVNRFKLISKMNHQCNAIRVGFIGRLTDEKGVPLLLEVVHKAIKDSLDVRFVIMGDGPYKQYFSNLPNVEHFGFVPRDELNLWLSKVQIVLFFQKELGLAELEAMASGKAIVACDVGEVSQIIKHLENGILCTPDARSYIDAIKRLCEDPSLLKGVSRKARETAVKCFSWDIIGCNWLSLCVECLKEEV
ncbi:MAG: glycosyltransferase family 4 protein [Methanophagales archaeon]|nr:glycosyltransferase family 4 protein [Methanophagales archaeon]